MSRGLKPRGKRTPSPYVLTKEHTERLPPARIETAEQAGARAIALLGSIGLVSPYAQHNHPGATAIPGFVRWRFVRQRWWFVIAAGARGAPPRDLWELVAVIDAHTGEFRWWRFRHDYDRLLGR